MSTKIVVTLTASILLLAAVTLHARNSVSNIMQVIVPFDFLAGEKALPGGDYTVEVNAERGMIVLRSEGHQPVLLPTNAIETRTPARHSQLVFHRYGNSFFLAEVWRGNDAVGRTLFASATEKELARKKSPDQKIVVQAREQ
jgi:hypothetical protein